MIKKVLIALAIIITLGAGYYFISPFFINIQINEGVPISNTTSAPQEVEIKSAEIIGTSGHRASGVVRIIPDGDDTYIRYENFKTINGPDIYVYLAKDLEAKEYVNLGKVKATEGNVNYKIPTGVDTQDYKYVIVWCKAFGVLFNYADISGL